MGSLTLGLLILAQFGVCEALNVLQSTAEYVSKLLQISCERIFDVYDTGAIFGIWDVVEDLQ